MEQPKKDTYIPPELQLRIDAGSKNMLWTVEIIYTVTEGGASSGTTRRYQKRNLYSNEMLDFREKMFRYGFTIPLGPGHWKVIIPIDVISVELFKQSRYFPEP